MDNLQEWIASQENHGQDVVAQYNYMKDRHPVEWHGNVEMEINRYTRERN